MVLQKCLLSREYRLYLQEVLLLLIESVGDSPQFLLSRPGFLVQLRQPLLFFSQDFVSEIVVSSAEIISKFELSLRLLENLIAHQVLSDARENIHLRLVFIILLFFC